MRDLLALQHARILDDNALNGVSMLILEVLDLLLVDFNLNTVVVVHNLHLALLGQPRELDLAQLLLRDLKEPFDSILRWYQRALRGGELLSISPPTRLTLSTWAWFRSRASFSVSILSSRRIRRRSATLLSSNSLGGGGASGSCVRVTGMPLERLVSRSTQ